MATNFNKSEIFKMAWSFIRKNGFTLSEALKQAWLNAKVKKALYKGIVKFYFQKIDGSIREAYGTLKADLCPQTQGSGRKPCPSVQTYFDTEKQEWRCFKIANLLRIG